MKTLRFHFGYPSVWLNIVSYFRGVCPAGPAGTFRIRRTCEKMRERKGCHSMPPEMVRSARVARSDTQWMSLRMDRGGHGMRRKKNTSQRSLSPSPTWSKFLQAKATIRVRCRGASETSTKTPVQKRATCRAHREEGEFRQRAPGSSRPESIVDTSLQGQQESHRNSHNSE